MRLTPTNLHSRYSVRTLLILVSTAAIFLSFFPVTVRKRIQKPPVPESWYTEEYHLGPLPLAMQSPVSFFSCMDVAEDWRYDRPFGFMPGVTYRELPSCLQENIRVESVDEFWVLSVTHPRYSARHFRHILDKFDEIYQDYAQAEQD